MTDSDADSGPDRCDDPDGGRYLDTYDAAVTLPDLFEVVKDMVECELDRHRAGLMLGLVDLGISQGGFVGGYFVVGGNAIVINRQAVGVIRVRNPELVKPYQFYLLLHEFLHAFTLRRLSIEVLGVSRVDPCFSLSCVIAHVALLVFSFLIYLSFLSFVLCFRL